MFSITRRGELRAPLALPISMSFWKRSVPSPLRMPVVADGEGISALVLDGSVN